MQKRRPAISWNITGICNYDCSYCVQKKSTKKLSPNITERNKIIETFHSLNKSFEVKISGGEPFLCPDFLQMVQGLVSAKHKISILTNFSANLNYIFKFIEIAGENLRTFSTSLHLEKTTVDEFLNKSLEVIKKLSSYPKATFVVNSVVIPNKIDELIEIKKHFERFSIKFYPQLMRVDGNSYIYSPDDQEKIKELIGDATPSTANIGFNFKGKLCWAGVDYFILNYKGDAYRCYPGKRFGDGYLGSFVDGTFKLWDEPKLCNYDVCPCTVPINRGMIENY